jgi:SAM-dependent methyltransferase
VSPPVVEPEKQHAVAAHTAQAGQFACSYDAAEDGYGSCFAYSRRRLDECIACYLPLEGAGLRVLDVGCGTGHHMKSLAGRGYAVAGVDGSEAMLEHARANNPGSELHLADVDRLPFPDASFDYVLCIEVLRYLRDPGPCVREMARVLRPGGTALVTATPLLNLNGYWLVNRLAVALPVRGFVRLRQFFTTSGRLRRVFGESGFQQVAIHGVYFGPVNWIERLARGLLRPALRAWEPWDRRLADRPLLRELSNMFLVRAVRADPPGARGLDRY